MFYKTTKLLKFICIILSYTIKYGSSHQNSLSSEAEERPSVSPWYRPPVQPLSKKQRNQTQVVPQREDVFPGQKPL